jgi:hypothetical protein
LRGHGHIRSDERILGESNSVNDILLRADEEFEHKYELKQFGYDLNGIALRVGEICDLELDEISFKDKR